MSVHVYPNDGTHDTTGNGETCWCCPEVQWIDPDTGLPWAGDGPLVTHTGQPLPGAIHTLHGWCAGLPRGVVSTAVHLNYALYRQVANMLPAQIKRAPLR